MPVAHDARATTVLPFALRNHEAAFVEDEKLLGDPSQVWTWEPIGDLSADVLAIYATGGNTTTRQTGSGQWDSGEFQ